MKVILAFDLGTTSNRVIAYSKEGKIVARSSYEFEQKFPRPGWVEHNPVEILDTTFKAARDVIERVGVENVEAAGITNQRETTILWDSTTGKPVYNAIVWQCRRTASICDELEKYHDLIREKTGLFVDPYFSATKIKWLLENVKEAKEVFKKGDLLFGTVDTWILWNLTKGRIHATDTSNASRTMLFNINSLEYDKELLSIFSIPENILPGVKESAAGFGFIDKSFFGKEVPIAAILGDQQASLFAQGCWDNTKVKNTYGTGLFVMMNVGGRPVKSGRLVSTVAWTRDGKTDYALEGPIFVGGAAIQWLRDGLEIIEASHHSEKLAEKLASNEGVYFVPALTGLGAPYWDSNARGSIFGLTRGTKREHIVRAALEALAYQTRDVVEEMRKVADTSHSSLFVDGGATANDFLMQFQADILDLPVEKVKAAETTSFGVAGLAGLHSGFWSEKEFLEAREVEKEFLPKMSAEEREKNYSGWREAVSRVVISGERSESKSPL